MKRYYIVLMLLLSLPALNAQTKFSPGLLTASGSMSYQKISIGTSELVSVFSLSPSVGIFMNDKIQMIYGVEYSRVSYPEDGLPSGGSTDLTFGGRYYYPLGADPVYGGAIFNYGKHSGSSDGSSRMAFQLGLLKFISTNAALDIGLEYERSIGTSRMTTTTIGVGLVFFFTKP